MTDYTPIEVAMMLVRCGQDVTRDLKTGLFVVDGTVPPTELTLPQYESGLRVLDLRAKAEAMRNAT